MLVLRCMRVNSATAVGELESPMGLAPLELDRIARAYTAPPWWYDLRGFLILTFSYRSTLWRQVRFFARHMAARHLEVAIGSGTLLALILRWRAFRKQPAARITGFDYADAMIAGAFRRFRGRSEITLDRADAGQLPYRDASFQSASIANAFHCLPDPDRALRELARVLRPGGKLAMNVLLFPRGIRPLRWLAARINAWGQRKGILHTPYELADVIARLAAAGFTPTEIQVQGNCCHLLAFTASTASALQRRL